MKNAFLIFLVFLNVKCNSLSKSQVTFQEEVPLEQKFLEDDIEQIDTSEIKAYRMPDGEINVYKFTFEPNLYCCGDFVGEMQVKNDSVFLIARYKWDDPKWGKKPDRLVDIGISYQVYHFKLEEEKIPSNAIFVFKRIP